MYKYKICVYAICKNEEKFIKRWYESVKEADNVYVLDTGSTDNSVNLLKECGISVKRKIIKPWRFDVARNESLKMVPEDTDICICLDLDEIIEKGWRIKLEDIWEKETTRLSYNYNWSLDDNNKPLVNFYIQKIHTRNDYVWTHPVHEVLTYCGKQKEKIVTTDLITVNHYPDKNKSRSSYLPLLELSVKENPMDDRNMHYLGREYMFYGKWEKAIKTLKKHLKLPNATWRDERCASMRFIARCYSNLNQINKARIWGDRAIKEAPYLRDPYIEMALIEYNFGNLCNVKKYCLLALKINNHPKTYINETFSWDNTVYDLLSISYYDEKNYKESLYYAQKALVISPNDERIKKNIKLIEEKIK